MEVAVCQYGGKLLKRRIGKCCEFLGQTSQCIGRVSCICRKTKSNDKSAICDTDNKFCKQDQDVQQDVWLQVRAKRLTLSQVNEQRKIVWGRVALLGVAMLWGTYAPSIRYILSFSDSPSSTALTTLRAIIAVCPLLLLQLLSENTTRIETVPQRSSELSGIKQVLNYTSPQIWIAGAELGFWNFLATQSQTVGLEFTTATRAGFLIQATQVFTPLLSKVGGEDVGSSVWLGCLMALLGTVLISIDKIGSTGGSFSLAMFSGSIVGDAMVICAAFFYSLATVRLGKYAFTFNPASLATAKSCALAVVACLCISLQTLYAGQSIASIVEGWGESKLMWGAIVWSAIGPGALAALLQTVGQAAVPASQAQVVFCVVPLFSSLCAYLLLGERALGLLGWIGGFLVILAGVVVSMHKSQKLN
eukprot:TRINITY_DN20958_c0_g2_i2.p1 TRINITY_DN20958_c0_g2~~TRINITY_DN20958_c0_g2_i2.p1  ORF type:complete len:418 (-),score=27.35 TRINITY_DN20958_c0_g2_i2:264-1517(-)